MGISPLVVCVANGLHEKAKLLIDHGADVNIRYGELASTPLHLAFECEDDEMIELLLKHKADYTALNKNLQTPIAFTNER